MDGKVAAVGAVALGYHAVRVGMPLGAAGRGERVMSAFARAEGLELAGTFCDDDPGRPLEALGALIAAVRAGGVAAVVVPSVEVFGSGPWVQREMRSRVVREAGVPVLVAERRGCPERSR